MRASAAKHAVQRQQNNNGILPCGGAHARLQQGAVIVAANTRHLVSGARLRRHRKILDHYTLGATLGKGSFAVVKEVR